MIECRGMIAMVGRSPTQNELSVLEDQITIERSRKALRKTGEAGAACS